MTFHVATRTFLRRGLHPVSGGWKSGWPLASIRFSVLRPSASGAVMAGRLHTVRAPMQGHHWRCRPALPDLIISCFVFTHWRATRTTATTVCRFCRHCQVRRRTHGMQWTLFGFCRRCHSCPSFIIFLLSFSSSLSFSFFFARAPVYLCLCQAELGDEDFEAPEPEAVPVFFSSTFVAPRPATAPPVPM